MLTCYKTVVGGSAANTAVSSDLHTVSDITKEREGSCGGVGIDEWRSEEGRGGGECESVVVRWS